MKACRRFIESWLQYSFFVSVLNSAAVSNIYLFQLLIKIIQIFGINNLIL